MVWNIAEYLTLFGIVLLHEFGHALACRSVGGVAKTIMLWPLGGVAFVAPPQRPAAMLWSIVAGPLVNLVLAPVAFGLALLAAVLGLSESAQHLCLVFATINVALFLFNMLPIYPLDGGQILRSLLWFVVGRERSLAIAAGLGLVVSGVALVATLAYGEFWLAALAGFAAWQSWKGLRLARARAQVLALPRHTHLQCPSCGDPPVVAPLWQCSEGHRYDGFATRGQCPQCGARATAVACLSCSEVTTIDAWGFAEAREPIAAPVEAGPSAEGGPTFDVH